MYEARDQIEPKALRESYIEGEPPSEHEIELSKAISLKRIADSLDTANEQGQAG